MLTKDEQYDAYVAERTKHHVAVLHAKLRAGDPLTVGLVDDTLGAKLFDSAAWAELIVTTARGENFFHALLCKVVEELAETEAHKDVEKAEAERASYYVPHEFDLNKMVENMVLRSNVFTH
jgi:hypothetical protein